MIGTASSQVLSAYRSPVDTASQGQPVGRLSNKTLGYKLETLVPHINVFAVLAAAASSFLLGGLWYSPMLFGTAWQREAGDTRRPGEGHPLKVFGLSLAFALIAALVYSLVIPQAANILQAIAQGLGVGLGLVAASFGINYQFANRSLMLLLIDGGYHAVQFTLYGLILGLWH